MKIISRLFKFLELCFQLCLDNFATNPYSICVNVFMDLPGLSDGAGNERATCARRQLQLPLCSLQSLCTACSRVFVGPDLS